MMNVQPKVQLSVQVGTEEDVATVVSSSQMSEVKETFHLFFTNI